MILSNRYRHKVVRDLAFALTEHTPIPYSSSYLITKEYVNNIKVGTLEWLDFLDLNPSILHDFLEDSQPRRLGFYFEHLLRFWFLHSDTYKLIGANIQVFKKKVTLSELDFLIQNINSGKFYHIESALKLYLNYNQTEWIGPNAKDTLERKMTIALHKQREVLHTSYGKEVLNKYKITNIEFKLYMKGYFFYHPSVNPKASYHWVKINEIEMLEGKQYLWCELPKNYWMSAAVLAPNELDIVRWKEIKQDLKEYFKTSNRAVMIAKLHKQDGKFYEIKRYFIVAENWPQLET